jgi:excisionase family DNA binding protein
MEARPGVMTAKEAAAYLRISESKLLDGLRRGLIPGKKVLGQWRVLRSELHRWLTSTSTPDPEATWPREKGGVT